MKENKRYSIKAKELLSDLEMYEIKAGETNLATNSQCKSICSQCVVCPPACTVCTTNIKHIFRK